MKVGAFCIRNILMKKRILYFLVSLVAALTVSSCTEEGTDIESINKQTILVFMPWTGTANGSQGLYPYFKQNLDSIESAILKARQMDGKVLVFLSSSANKSSLYEITLENNKIQHTPIKEYSGNSYTTADGITQLLNDVKNIANALNYAMVISSHGMGWTFKDDWNNYPYSAKPKPISHGSSNGIGKFVPYYPTRFYGSVDDISNYGTDIESLETGIRNAGIKMQFILFDDCYMANVETAYQLKDVTNFLIGSTSEVMVQGMPYQTMWAALASPIPTYATITDAFYKFYSNYKPPCGTLSVIDCRQMDRLAELMKLINTKFKFDSNKLDSIQVLDGFSKSIFYDMKDYVDSLCTDKDLLNDFNSALKQATKSTVHTDSIYSALNPVDGGKYIKLKRYSGITISDPSIHNVALKGKEKTTWWKATH